jgi:uncharacterized protein Usg
MKEITKQRIIEELKGYGITLKELYEYKQGTHERCGGVVIYDKFNLEKKIDRLDKFLSFFKRLYVPYDYGNIKRYKETNYFINDQGEVYSVCGVIKKIKLYNRKGYPYIKIESKKIPIHKLVMELFGPPRPSENHIIRHKNDISSDARIENLMWGYQIENMLDKKHNNDERVRLIKNLYNKKIYSLEEISIITKVSLSDLEEIIRV